MMKQTDNTSQAEYTAKQTDSDRNKAAQWAVYLIRTASNQLYCGVTTDVERRLNEHSGSKKGAKYLKGKGPLNLAWTEQVGDKKTAMRLEYRIKRLSKAKKELIINHTLKINTLLE